MRKHPADPVRTIAVLADDLTSAGDGAAPFRGGGHRAKVLLPEAVEPGAVPPDGVVAVDLGSRLLDEAAAVALAGRFAEAFARSDLLIKTVDSTLRGHVAAEVRAAHAGSRRRAVVVAPAFPAEGRTTVRGVQYVHGVPVHETDFARDPVHPVRTADLTRLLPEAEVLEPEQFGKLPELIDGGGVFVCSAATDADLRLLVDSVPMPGDVLWVGSPGLAAALAGRHPAVPTVRPPEPPMARRPLVVVGSANPATRRQLDRLRPRMDVTAVEAAEAPVEGLRALRRTAAPVLVVHTPDARRTDARSLTADLALFVRELVADGLVDGLVLTGGETAVAALEALGAAGIDLVDEPEPGVARGVLLSPPHLPVLIKAGGFGDDGTLDRLLRLLMEGGPITGSPPIAERGPVTERSPIAEGGPTS
ncbi:four-carbon acid sugar kinase family protein [Streptomyces sp. NPDC014870]|uniref:four-carbon acid sugar kinase family protein n=1 Tax=Streptomyces sp. NPDC014870 TaxID=3364925 RepID=UPI0037020256